MRWAMRGLLFAAGMGAALAAPPVVAQGLADYDYENLELTGAGASVGVVWPARVERAVAVELRADLGHLGPRVRVLPSISFWASELKEDEIADLRSNILRLCREAESDCVRDLGDIRVSDLAFGVMAQYAFADSAAFTPYLGAGGSVHLLNGQGEAIDDTFVEGLLDAVAPGLDFQLGASLSLGRALRLFAEARAAVATDVQYAGLFAGGSWTLPTAPPRTQP